LSDPLTQVAGLIQPRAPFSKIISAAGEWRVSRSESGRPFYCAILEGRCCLAAESHEAITLEAGDFVLIPAARDFSISSVPPPTTPSDSPHVMLPGGEVRIGEPGREPDYRALVGYCVLGSSDASLLLSLLPKIIHVRGERRLATLVELVGEEARADRPGKEIILAHLLEVLFIEAMRSTAATAAAPGLLRGLPFDRFTVFLNDHGPLTGSPRSLRSPVRHSLIVFSASWVCRRWSISHPGGWRWPRTCSGVAATVSPAWRNAPATVQPTLSAPRSSAIPARRPLVTRDMID
jgi:hypothetical protein